MPYIRASCALKDVMGTAPFCKFRQDEKWSALVLHQPGKDDISYPCIPNTQPIPMATRQNMIMLSIPLHLRRRIPPIRQSHHSPIIAFHPQIPPFHAPIYRGRGHEVWITRVPVDIGDGALVGVYDAGEGGGGRGGGEVPDEEFLVGGGED